MLINAQSLIFFAFAAVAILSAIMVVASRNPVRAVLFLVVTFFASVGLWLFAYAEFLALILVVVYVGAVMTLFLFVVMMMDVDIVSRKQRFIRYTPIGLAVVGLLAGLMFWIARPAYYAQVHANEINNFDQLNNVTALGQILYTDYAYPFEIAALLLLVSIVAAIGLAHRGPRRGTKVQHIEKQLSVKRSDRIRLVK